MRLSQLRAQLTLANTSDAFNLALKMAAVLVAFGALQYFFFRPNVELTVGQQAFLDETAVASAYAAQGRAMPDVVTRIVHRYNAQNEEDLGTRRNDSQRRGPSAEHLCQTSRATVEALFPRSCQKSPALGFGHYYERLLVGMGGRELSTPDLLIARDNLYAGQYLKVQVLFDNTGNATARNVRLRIPDGFVATQAIDNFALGSDDAPFVREFQTRRGIDQPGVQPLRTGDPGRQPQSQFGVDWDTNDTDSTAPFIAYGALLLFVVWLIVVVTELFRKAAHAEQG